MDRSVANAVLETLQGRHNAEQAAIAALRDQQADVLRAAKTNASEGRSGGFWRGLLNRD
jgi:hypothetical protein